MCYGLNNPYSFSVSGPSALMGNTDVAGNVTAMINVQAQGNVISNCGRHVLALKKDLPFDMPHPNKEGWRLRHVCIEGPEIAVYCRGRVPADGIIHLPTFWDGLVNPDDMSISLTPIPVGRSCLSKKNVGVSKLLLQTMLVVLSMQTIILLHVDLMMTL